VSSISTKLFFLFFLAASFSSAQKQVVFLQHGNVIARYTEGDRFKFKLKNRQWREGYITELTDFSLITSALDTISFLSIDKMRIKKSINATNGLGGLLFVGGLLYIAVDQANTIFGSTQSGFDNSDRNALILAGVGAAILFIKPRYQRVKRNVTVRTIDYTSPYYKFNH
jgi:hypothetical protein